MVKINIPIPKNVQARIDARDLKSMAKRNRQLDQLRGVSNQPIIERSNKRTLASLERLGKRSRKKDLSYIETTKEEDEETFLADVARDLRRQNEKEMNDKNEKRKMSAKDLKFKLADIEDQNEMLKVKIEKLVQDVIKKNRKIKRQRKTINQLNALLSNYKTSHQQ